jgi:hypothetical protein
MEPTNPIGLLIFIGILLGAFFIKWGGENKN